MIIKWTENRVKVIGNIKLLPGHNEVNSDIWKELVIRCDLQPEIDSGRIILVSDQIEEKGKEGEIKKKTVDEFVELSNKKKRNVIEETYNIKTLEEWREKEIDADIRNKIDDQIKAIKDHKVETPTDKPGSHV